MLNQSTKLMQVDCVDAAHCVPVGCVISVLEDWWLNPKKCWSLIYLSGFAELVSLSPELKTAKKLQAPIYLSWIAVFCPRDLEKQDVQCQFATGSTYLVLPSLHSDFLHEDPELRMPGLK